MNGPSVDAPAGWGSTLLGATLAAVGRPSTWAPALAGFLVRGGLVVLAAPIVVIPSTIGVANAVAPTLTPFVFGQASPGFTALVGLVVAGLTAWVVLGGLIGSWTDLALVRAATSDEDLDLAGRLIDRPGAVWRGLAVRLIAHVPLAVALGWGATRIIDASYRQLILPDELTTPIVVRVLRDVPDALGLVVVAWLLGESVGGLAQRRLWSSRASIPRAIGWAIGRLVRRPIAGIGTVVFTGTVVIAVVVSAALVAGIAWNRLRVALVADVSPGELGAAVLVFVSLWLAALLLAGAAAAWRSFAWTAEAFRRSGRSIAPLDARTIGEHEVGRPGEWPSTGASGSL